MWTRRAVLLSIPHAALCVSGRIRRITGYLVGTFQCRTQHCVCRDRTHREIHVHSGVSMPHAALCVSGRRSSCPQFRRGRVSMPHAALCVSGQGDRDTVRALKRVSMPHAALCVSGQAMLRFDKSMNSGFNAARSIVCVGTFHQEQLHE